MIPRLIIQKGERMGGRDGGEGREGGGGEAERVEEKSERCEGDYRK